MKKTITSAKTSKIILIVLTALLMVVSFCGCSAASQKDCNHNYYLFDYAEASTTTNGYKEFTCSNCGNSYKEIIPIKEAIEAKEANAMVPQTTKEEAPDLTRKRSVNLFDLPVYSDKEVFSGGVNDLCYSPEKTDVDGWKHKDCYMICGSTYESWVRYEINGKYTTVSGNLYDANSSGGSGWLEFYEGEDFLAATPKVDNENSSVEFEIDITGVEYLTVHFCATKAGTWMIADDVMMTN